MGWSPFLKSIPNQNVSQFPLHYPIPKDVVSSTRPLSVLLSTESQRRYVSHFCTLSPTTHVNFYPCTVFNDDDSDNNSSSSNTATQTKLSWEREACGTLEQHIAYTRALRIHKVAWAAAWNKTPRKKHTIQQHSTQHSTWKASAKKK